MKKKTNSKTKREKVVLAYSGGLDTTCIIPWLKENFNYDVICCCIDVGQNEELKGLDARAKKCGASALHIVDAREEFANDYIIPCVKANVCYENEYLLGTSMARPLIAKILVDVAKKEKAVAICHGATGKGNDQIRFEASIKALAPYIKIIAPWRMNELWGMKSREDEIDYCKKHGINLPFSSANSYSRDRNLWHISHEGLELEDISNEPNYNKLLVMSTHPKNAPNKEEIIEIEFNKGVPIKLNNKSMSPLKIIETLNSIGGKNGIGIIDIVENRVVGMKSRGVYETPGGTILMYAHSSLMELVLDRQSFDFRKTVSNKLSQIVYEGTWFTPLREALFAFSDKLNEVATGKITLKLYKGNIFKVKSSSPYSLYEEKLSSFTTGDLYDHNDATGYINLFSLSMKVRAMKEKERKKKN